MSRIRLNTKIEKLKNILAIYGVFVMIVFTITDPNGHGAKHGIFIKILGILLPLGISSLSWNKWSYNNLISNEENLYSRSKLTYNGFMLIGFFLILFFDVGMTLGLYHFFTN